MPHTKPQYPLTGGPGNELTQAKRSLTWATKSLQRLSRKYERDQERAFQRIKDAERRYEEAKARAEANRDG